MAESSPPDGPDLPDDDDLEELLVRAFERLDAGGPTELARFLEQHPEEAPRVRAHLHRLQRMGLFAEAAPGARELPERFGEFRVVGVLGHGGMGIVYRAVQESLGREVALKLVRPDQLVFPGARERFRREVELVARMQHPGIVPIYAIGSEADVPYFAMELVSGASLAQVIEHVADRAPRSSSGLDIDRAIAACTGDRSEREVPELFRGTWTQVVLRIVREIADALEHAHRRGVLHRDVKPSNVMLTREGRVLLLDFGLAGGGGGERLTRTGTPLGSLAYMAPELLDEASAPADARCDVYSLGATCFELLALRLPYQASNPLRLAELAASAARPKLATIHPGVSWEVETVVATAMDPDPARRYASASLLSRDLDNVLAHRPIDARNASPLLRARRWTQRHPARATAVAAVTLALLVVPSLWAWQESRARERLQDQRDQLAATNVALREARARALAESERARANFVKLQYAVDTMLTKVGDESLRDIPRMEVVRRELLVEALRFYEGFLAETPDDPELRVETARVRSRAAVVHALLGDHGAVQQQIELALDALEAGAASDPTLLPEVAQAHQRLAGARRLRGDLAGAAAAAAASVGAWEALVAAADDARAAAGLAAARIESSLVAVDRGDLPAALAELETSLEGIGAWQVRHPGEVALDHVRARTLSRAAVWRFQVAMQQRDRAAALPMLERAVEMQSAAGDLWRAVVARAPHDAQIRADAAQCSVSLAMPLQVLGRITEARDCVAAGVAEFAALVVDFPSSPRRRAELAYARGNLAALFGHLDALDESLAESAAAAALWEQLGREFPENDEYAIGLAHALQGQAVGRWSADAPSAAILELVRDAGAAADRALAVRPDNPTYRRVRRKVAETEATVALEAGDHARVVAAARQLADERLAPTEPVLAAALIARAMPLAAADPQLAAADSGGRVAAYRAEADALIRGALEAGATIPSIEADPRLADQWGKPGFAELWAALRDAGR